MGQKSLLNKQIQGIKSYIFGHDNEKKAEKFLKSKGFSILFKNFSTKYGEIDLIALKGEIIHFVEVKSSQKYESEYYLDEKKLHKIIKSIDAFMQKYEKYLDYDYCIDLIAINGGKINHIENISF